MPLLTRQAGLLPRFCHNMGLGEADPITEYGDKKQTMNRHQLPQCSRCTLAFLLGILLCVITCGCVIKTPGNDGDGPPKPLYTSDAIIRVKSGDYIYLARVTADTLPTAKEVPVYIFTPHIQRKIGATLPIGIVRGIRAEPADGWGTRLVAAEYFDGIKWSFEWNIQEMEDHYLLPETFQGVRRLEFSNVRFPIPIPR